LHSTDAMTIDFCSLTVALTRIGLTLAFKDGWCFLSLNTMTPTTTAATTKTHAAPTPTPSSHSTTPVCTEFGPD